jgi:hypothetical protein
MKISAIKLYVISTSTTHTTPGTGAVAHLGYDITNLNLCLGPNETSSTITIPWPNPGDDWNNYIYF